eukprot:1377226-Ditylum_brightwellii.AAC.1
MQMQKFITLVKHMMSATTMQMHVRVVMMMLLLMMKRSFFWECAQFEDQNGCKVNIAPHCSNGMTIVIGAYKDKFCAKYMGADYLAGDVTGEYFDNGKLDYVSGECIMKQDAIKAPFLDLEFFKESLPY